MPAPTHDGASGRMDALAVVQEILEANRVATFHYFEALEHSHIQERVALNRWERAVVASALRMRATLKLPFHDALLLCMDDKAPRPRLLRAVGEHHSYPLREHQLRPAESVSSALSALLRRRRPDSMLVLSSEVTLINGQRKHIPMLDFRFTPSRAQQRLIQFVLQELRAPPGYLLISGGSYHYYGGQLVSVDELRRWLAHSLLYSPLLDKIWIAHQLIEGRCGLRVSPKPSGADVPRLALRV